MQIRTEVKRSQEGDLGVGRAGGNFLEHPIGYSGWKRFKVYFFSVMKENLQRNSMKIRNSQSCNHNCVTTLTFHLYSPPKRKEQGQLWLQNRM